MVISKFKAQCIAVLKESRRGGEPLIVTWRGQPLARIEPIQDQLPKRRFGALRGKLRIQGDIVRTDWSGDWEATP